ncbi:hypothetical protein J2766_001088 [Agrobacterium tumefaciens]|uniref:Uncharacterized protein n=1 Tax=Agrobacterium tumefaciens TaxID=358 RepID=A0AAW8LQI4_AGRTU|nr:hypothetical protein [Agrobacterium tumefaciens]MBP2564529.1 hypothetical protein [Agrobacterium tumefaciens]MDR6701606.1 hypothetical protein [Agrobacterium tumefaciens]
MDEALARQRLRYLQLKAKAGTAAPSEPEKPTQAMDALSSVGSGLVRGTPKLMDFATGLTGEALNQAQRVVGRDAAPLGDTYKSATVFNDLVSKALGPEYEPEYATGDVAKFVAEIASPGGVARVLKNGVGAARGMAGSLDDYVRDPEALKQVYTAWKNGLRNVKLDGADVYENMVKPAIDNIGEDLQYATAAGKEKAAEILSLGDRKTMADLYAYRRSLGNVNDNAVTQPIRQATKAFMENRVGTEGLDAYRRASTFEDVNHALRNMGNEGTKATRTKINNLDETGMSAAEKAAKNAAGRGSVGESVLRAVERGAGAIPSAIVAGPLAPVVYGAGRLAGAGADSLAAGRIRALQEVLLNNRAVPSAGERAGAALRDALMKVRR